MFEHRLGLALGLTLGQIRALPYEEYRSWKNYYKLEPFGWQDDEYRMAAVIAMIYNTRAKHTRKVDEFMRDPQKAVNEQVDQASRRERWLKASKEERMEMLKSSVSEWGAKPKVRKDKIHGGAL